MSQPFILNDERLMGQSNHRMSVAAEKGVEGRTASPLIFLSLGEEAMTWIWWREILADKARISTTNKKKKGILSPRGRCRVPFKVQKRKKENFVKAKTKNKTINYQSSRKGTPWAETPYQNRHFSSILTLARSAQQETILLLPENFIRYVSKLWYQQNRKGKVFLGKFQSPIFGLQRMQPNYQPNPAKKVHRHSVCF